MDKSDDNTVSVEELLAKYASAGIRRGAGLYFDQATALSVLKEAQAAGFRIILVEAFFLTANSTQPSLEDSVDFETYGVPDGGEPYDYARRLVSAPSRQKMFFDIEFWPSD